MRIVSRRKMQLIKSLLALIIASSGFSLASAEIGKSGLPLPRFVSLKSKKVNMRVGPGSEYQVEWMYIKQGLPVEIIKEFDNWRKIRDPQGNEGWILHSLLSGKRTAIISPWDRGKDSSLISMLDAPEGTAKLKAQLQPGVIAKVNYCDNQWCELSADNAHGYVKQELLWGVYPDESFEN